MHVTVYSSNIELGEAAAADFSSVVRGELERQNEVAVIFATGNSQLSFMQALRQHSEIPWDKITAFHMDEYLGMSDQHPASFRRFIREKVADVVHPKVFYGMEGDAPDVAAEMARYTDLLTKHRPALCVMGIGENGHIAFNDPPADGNRRDLVHVVQLAETARRQQVGEGHFPTLDDVPSQALSLTIHALLQPPHLMVIAPEARKAVPVQAALEGPISADCPASVLRTHPDVRLYLDADSARLLKPHDQSWDLPILPIA